MGILRSTPKIFVFGLLRLLWPQRCAAGLVRVGSEYDGGYLVPAEAVPAGFVASPGVAETFDFELDLAHMGAAVLMLDPSVDRPNGLPPDVDFQQKKLTGSPAGEHSLTISDLVAYGKANSKPGPWMLQIDIEGEEWEVFSKVRQNELKLFDVLVVEFHDLEKFFFPLQFLKHMWPLLRILTSFHVAHIHPNNCRPPKDWKGLSIPSIIEVTFHRRTSCRGYSLSPLPHPSDAPCLPHHPNFSLSHHWFASK